VFRLAAYQHKQISLLFVRSCSFVVCLVRAENYLFEALGLGAPPKFDFRSGRNTPSQILREIPSAKIVGISSTPKRFKMSLSERVEYYLIGLGNLRKRIC
jgi:hypothetical protein